MSILIGEIRGNVLPCCEIQARRSKKITKKGRFGKTIGK